MNEFLILIFQLIVLIFSVMVHEVSHGLVAYKLGDDTAKVMGRLNLNPKNHLDPFGSFLLPLTLFLISKGSFVIGWAKPVPYNPNNLKNPKIGAALIGIAGPASNLMLAVIFGIVIRLLAPFLNLQPEIMSGQMTSGLGFIFLLNIIVFVNILLAVFNLVPIPPLDGSKLLFALLPYRYASVQKFLEDYGMMVLLFFIFFGFSLISPLIYGIYSVLVGRWAIF
ncbi:MAG: site-2 protease family protein [bacterium]|nr:site-2 protease family protein [bacterium]